MITPVAGRIDSALTHLAAYGLGSILEDQNVNNVRVWWEDGQPARIMVQGRGNSGQSHGANVLDHAQRHSRSDSWTKQEGTRQGQERGLFSPKVAIPKVPDGEKKAATSSRKLHDEWRVALFSEWQRWQKARHEFLKDVEFVSNERRITPLDIRLIGALGEPAYWGSRQGVPLGDFPSVIPPRAHDGASRWEMTDHGSGRCFVKDTLARLADAVSKRDPDSLQEGLEGTALPVNTLKRKNLGLGFCHPKPVDEVLAWCAAWGLACLPLAHHVGRVSTSAAIVVTPEGMTRAGFPIVTRPTSMALWRRLLASHQLQDMIASSDQHDKTAWAAWQERYGINSVFLFDQRTESAGPNSRTERYLGLGRPVDRWR